MTRSINIQRTTTLIGALALLGVSGAAMAQEESGIPARTPGVVRACLVKPKVQSSAMDAAQAGDALQNMLAEYLGGPTLEVLFLRARVQSQVIEEARLSECDYVMHATLVHKRGSANSMFSQALSNVAGTAASSYIPGSSPVTSAAMGTVLQTAADYAAVVEARDEMRFEYRLQDLAGKTVLEQTGKKKAQEDGEDLITPLIEGAAEAISAALIGG